MLDDRRALRAKVSHAKPKTVSAGRYRAIARHELEVSVPEFWECIRSGTPVKRAVEVEEVTYKHPAWVVNVLAGQMRMSGEDITLLGREHAEHLVRQHWQQRLARGHP